MCANSIEQPEDTDSRHASETSRRRRFLGRSRGRGKNGRGRAGFRPSRREAGAQKALAGQSVRPHLRGTVGRHGRDSNDTRSRFARDGEAGCHRDPERSWHSHGLPNMPHERQVQCRAKIAHHFHDRWLRNKPKKELLVSTDPNATKKRMSTQSPIRWTLIAVESLVPLGKAPRGPLTRRIFGTRRGNSTGQIMHVVFVLNAQVLTTLGQYRFRPNWP